MNQPFDKEISFRTAIVMAAVAYLAGPRIHMPVEVATPLGGALGIAIDSAIFHLKAWYSARKFPF